MLKNLSQRNKRALIILAVIIIPLLAYNFFWQKQLNKLDELKTEKKEMQSVIEGAEDQERLVNGLRREIDQIESELDFYTERLYPAVNKDVTAVEVAGSLQPFGDVTYFEPREIVKRENYRMIPIILEMQSDYRGVLNSIENLEEGDKTVKVDSLNIETVSSENDAASPALESRMVVYVYQLISEGQDEVSPEDSFAGGEVQESIGKLNPFRPNIDLSPDEKDSESEEAEEAIDEDYQRYLPGQQSQIQPQSPTQQDYKFPKAKHNEGELYFFPKQ